MGTWEPLLGTLGTFTWEPGNLYLGPWEPLLGNLGTFTWDPGNLCLGTFTWEPGNLYLGTFTWNLGTLGEWVLELLRSAPKPLLWLKTPKHSAVGEKPMSEHAPTKEPPWRCLKEYPQNFSQKVNQKKTRSVRPPFSPPTRPIPKDSPPAAGRDSTWHSWAPANLPRHPPGTPRPPPAAARPGSPRHHSGRRHRRRRTRRSGTAVCR